MSVDSDVLNLNPGIDGNNVLLFPKNTRWRAKWQTNKHILAHISTIKYKLNYMVVLWVLKIISDFGVWQPSWNSIAIYNSSLNIFLPK